MSLGFGEPRLRNKAAGGVERRVSAARDHRIKKNMSTITDSCSLFSSPPRANYIKPKPIDGQKGKEGLIKKVERKWQEEVQEGTDVMAGKIENPSGWKKFKGTVLTVSVKSLIEQKKYVTADFLRVVV